MWMRWKRHTQIDRTNHSTLWTLETRRKRQVKKNKQKGKNLDMKGLTGTKRTKGMKEQKKLHGKKRWMDKEDE